jgi:hypothetical protein
MLHHLRTALVPFVIAMATGIFAEAAQAGRLSYVSSTGNDANACTLAAPCRTLTHAIAATTQGGEVRLIDSAGYGASITIGKSITVSGNGATIFAGPITISNASAVVTLRNLVLNGGGTPAGSSGVSITAATTVHIERCTIHGFPQDGVQLTGSAVDVIVTDSIMRNNGQNGMTAGTGVTGARLTVDNSRFESNAGEGLIVLGGIANVSRSLAAGNADAGFFVSNANINLTATTAARNVTGYANISGGMSLDSVTAYRNGGAGVDVTNTGTVRLSNSALIENGVGISSSGSSTVLTRQNNTVSGNGNDVSGPLTPLGGV